MATIARNHHYLPQGYLGAFTDTGNREGQLYGFDLAARRGFRTRPRNVAAEKDFNRFEADGQAPDFLETSLSVVEGTAATVMLEMGRAGQLAEDKDLVYVMNLITLLVVRNPRARRSLTRSQQQVAKTIGEMLVSDKRVYEHQVRKAREAGYATGPDVSFERMKEFIQLCRELRRRQRKVQGDARSDAGQWRARTRRKVSDAGNGRRVLDRGVKAVAVICLLGDVLLIGMPPNAFQGSRNSGAAPAVATR